MSVRRKIPVVVSTVLFLGLLAAFIPFGASATGPASQPSPTVFNQSGRPIWVGSVVATLTPVQGGCKGSYGVQAEGSEGSPAPEVVLELMPDCTVVVVQIGGSPAASSTTSGGSYSTPTPGVSP
jgi:hypothetical protein